MSGAAEFIEENGIFVAQPRPLHREDDYDSTGFELLLRMQREHFWYRGRHRFLWRVLQAELQRVAATAMPGAHSFVPEREVVRADAGAKAPCLVDLGGGCGGWIEYLHHQASGALGELALADSSPRALAFAGPVLARFATRYQVDLARLPWRERWDVACLLDVIEHLDDDAAALSEAAAGLKPGGLVLVSVPALRQFWSYNDEVARHRRRYAKRDMAALATATGLTLLRAEYFMFFLSPALLLSRLLSRPPRNASETAKREHAARAHGIPLAPLNATLGAVFSLEASLANQLSFPWGTSLAAVFQKPR